MKNGYTGVRILVVAVVCAFVLFSSSQAAVPFAPSASTGQCREPAGVAKNTALGYVYAADRGNDRINVFEDGDLLFSFGSSGSGSGQSIFMQSGGR